MMSRYKGLKTTLIISGICLVLIVAFVMIVGTDLSGSAALNLLACLGIAWAVITLGVVLKILKALRVSGTMLGLYLIGIPLVFLLTSMSNPYGGGYRLVASLFLACWAVVSGLATRSAKAVYWSLHLSAWTLGLGIFLTALSASEYGSTAIPPVAWLLLPIGLSILLAAQYGGIIRFLSTLSLLRKSTPQPVNAPPQANPVPYQQGYQSASDPVYEEGGQRFAYPAQGEQPQAQYPRGIIQ